MKLNKKPAYSGLNPQYGEIMRRIVPSAKPASLEIHSLEQLGQLVQHRRTTSGLRLDDAALLCDVAAGSLSNLENGRRAISADKLLQVLRGLGLTMLIIPREQLADFKPQMDQAPTP